MDRKVSREGAILKLTVLLAAFGISSIAQAAMVVQMTVNSNEDKLTITTPGNCASGNNTNGCVQASGRQPINFVLTGDKSCAAGHKWMLDHVALGMTEGSVGNLTPTAASDFGADAGSGRVSPDNQSANSIQIRNNNTDTYDVWYTVYATCQGSVIDSDPRIANDGSGR